MYERRGAQRVDLRQTSATGPTGIYRCDITTEAVHDDTDISVRATVYVGLYAGSGGMYSSLLEYSLALARVCCLAEFALLLSVVGECFVCDVVIKSLGIPSVHDLSARTLIIAKTDSDLLGLLFLW